MKSRSQVYYKSCFTSFFLYVKTNGRYIVIESLVIQNETAEDIKDQRKCCYKRIWVWKMQQNICKSWASQDTRCNTWEREITMSCLSQSFLPQGEIGHPYIQSPCREEVCLPTSWLWQMVYQAEQFTATHQQKAQKKTRWHQSWLQWK